MGSSTTGSVPLLVHLTYKIINANTYLIDLGDSAFAREQTTYKMTPNYLSFEKQNFLKNGCIKKKMVTQAE